MILSRQPGPVSREHTRTAIQRSRVRLDLDPPTPLRDVSEHGTNQFPFLLVPDDANRCTPTQKTRTTTPSPTARSGYFAIASYVSSASAPKKGVTPNNIKAVFNLGNASGLLDCQRHERVALFDPLRVGLCYAAAAGNTTIV